MQATMGLGFAVDLKKSRTRPVGHASAQIVRLCPAEARQGTAPFSGSTVPPHNPHPHPHPQPHHHHHHHHHRHHHHHHHHHRLQVVRGHLRVPRRQNSSLQCGELAKQSLSFSSTSCRCSVDKVRRFQDFASMTKLREFEVIYYDSLT